MSKKLKITQKGKQIKVDSELVNNDKNYSMTTRERLIDKYDACEFGIKTKVFQEYSQRSIDYIRQTENYSNIDLMLNIIKCIEKHSTNTVKNAMDMNTKIQKI